MRIKYLFLLLALSTSTYAGRFYQTVNDDPLYFDAKQSVHEWFRKSGECTTLSRMGDTTGTFLREVGKNLKHFKSDKEQKYVPITVVSCIRTGTPDLVWWIDDSYLNKL